MTTEEAPIRKITVLGGGSAGLIAALTLKTRIPALEVEVVYSQELGIIGVGEGTTPVLPRHMFEYLKLSPQEFFDEAEPVWKLGIHFLWGPNPGGFYYSFQNEYKNRLQGLSRCAGYYYDDNTRWTGLVSACMAKNRVFPRRKDGMPHFHKGHAYHIENTKLVGWLEKACRRAGVAFTEGLMESAERGPRGVAALRLKDGKRVEADLFLDASGFRSELLSKLPGVEYVSYASSLFCDRAVIAGRPRRENEEVPPYTLAETMNAGWCWRIEHENWINRGYVYSSDFISDDGALAEFRAKNPEITNEARVVKFKSGRYTDMWRENVVGVGNASGFVEPLEATALQVICLQSSTLADCLAETGLRPTPSMVALYNRYNKRQWDDIRDFLAIHYAFNKRLDTPFWRAAWHDTNLAGAAEVVRFFRENGPSPLAVELLNSPDNSFGMEGYLALLTGQRVPQERPWTPPAEERRRWHELMDQAGRIAEAGASAREVLKLIRSGVVRLQ